MVFLSAQPDEFYFFWQLKLLVNNFSSFGIPSKDIHILIGFDPDKGMSDFFEDWMGTCTQATIYGYPDTNRGRLYRSSIRPHIIAKHFDKFPQLKSQQIFYHDSDILFTRLPDFKKLELDDIWYASDTRSYLDSKYIIRKTNYETLERMAKIVGLPVDRIIEEDSNAGGAQYLLKGIDSTFWKKMEIDCEELYHFLELKKNTLGPLNGERYGIQSWCSDMWCLFWNAIAIDRKFKISNELDFSWADSPLEKVLNKPIVHYTGAVPLENESIFRKSRYSSCTPFFDDLSKIDENTSSITVVKEIEKYRIAQKKMRMDLSDVTFLIPIRIDSPERLENIFTVTKYLSWHFKTSIIVIEADSTQKIDPVLLGNEVKYQFIEDSRKDFHRTFYNNNLIALADTKHIVLYDADVIIPVGQLLKASDLLKDYEMVYPYDGHFVSLDPMMKAMFKKSLDTDLFEQNIGKHNMASCRSYGGAVFLVKEKFVAAGGENESFSTWGPEDMERFKRMLLLGYNLTRIKGNLFHLPHPRLENSGYKDRGTRVNYISKYIEICAMDRIEISKHVSSWEWLGKLKK